MSPSHLSLGREPLKGRQVWVWCRAEYLSPIKSLEWSRRPQRTGVTKQATFEGLVFTPPQSVWGQGVAEGLGRQQQNSGRGKNPSSGGEGGGTLWGHVNAGLLGLVPGLLPGPGGVSSCTSSSAPVTWEVKLIPASQELAGLSGKGGPDST